MTLRARPMMKPVKLSATVLATVLVLSGCGKEPPKGQVVARVNGVEITQRDLLVELSSDPRFRHLDGKKAQALALGALVDRKLLIGAARDALVDRSPDYIAARRRGDEILLVDHLGDRLLAEVPEPDPDKLRRAMAERPWMFASRRLLVVRRVVVPAAGQGQGQGRGQGHAGGAAAGTIPQSALDGLCRTAGGACRTQFMLVDTRDVDPAWAEAIARLAPGTAIVRSEGQASVGEAVVSSLVPPSDPAGDERLARSLLQQEARDEALALTLAHLRRTADIAYQQGMVPTP
ncbi:hypothetical protein [Novosphingobium nitrogenifigens]|nr:hypothetical protein [Novosphingobium nitrogenifigens]